MSDAEFADDRLPDRFWNKVTQEPGTGCWVWTRCLTTSGYGHFYVGGVGVVPGVSMAHRVTYMAFVGEIPEGLELDHLCRNRSCVNPAHLEPVTHAENVRRGALTKVVCHRGHEMAGDNIGYRRTGSPGIYRYCRACNAINAREWRESKRAA